MCGVWCRYLNTGPGTHTIEVSPADFLWGSGGVANCSTLCMWRTDGIDSGAKGRMEMKSNSEERSRLSRREVLIGGAVAAASAGLPFAALASTQEGEKQMDRNDNEGRNGGL